MLQKLFNLFTGNTENDEEMQLLSEDDKRHQELNQQIQAILTKDGRTNLRDGGTLAVFNRNQAENMTIQQKEVFLAELEELHSFNPQLAISGTLTDAELTNCEIFGQMLTSLGIVSSIGLGLTALCSSNAICATGVTPTAKIAYIGFGGGSALGLGIGLTLFGCATECKDWRTINAINYTHLEDELANKYKHSGS